MQDCSLRFKGLNPIQPQGNGTHPFMIVRSHTQQDAGCAPLAPVLESWIVLGPKTDREPRGNRWGESPLLLYFTSSIITSFASLEAFPMELLNVFLHFVSTKHW